MNLRGKHRFPFPHRGGEKFRQKRGKRFAFQQKRGEKKVPYVWGKERRVKQKKGRKITV